MESFLGLFQVKGGPPTNNFTTMSKKEHKRIPQVEKTRTTVNNSQEDDAERLLHRSQFVQLIEDYRRDSLALEFNHDTHAFTVGLIAQISDSLNPFFIDQI